MKFTERWDNPMPGTIDDFFKFFACHSGFFFSASIDDIMKMSKVRELNLTLQSAHQRLGTGEFFWCWIVTEDGERWKRHEKFGGYGNSLADAAVSALAHFWELTERRRQKIVL